MPILITTISILAITGIVWLINRASILRLRSGQVLYICPICAGVSTTWLWILIGLLSGWLINGSWLVIAVMGMGGSVVGIAYQVAKRLPANRSPLLWQTLFIPIGFIAIYELIHFQWIIFIIALIAMAILAWRFLKPKKSAKHNATIDKLTKKMDDCC